MGVTVESETASYQPITTKAKGYQIVTQPNSDQAAQFAAFQAWQASQGANGAQSGPTPDETPKLSIADVLKALVRSARLPDEATVHAYCEVVDDAFPAPSTSDSEAAEG